MTGGRQDGMSVNDELADSAAAKKAAVAASKVVAVVAGSGGFLIEISPMLCWLC